MSDEVWDPNPLSVGDRVRIRLSGECGPQWYPPFDFIGRTVEGLLAVHDPDEHGLVGTVDGIYEGDPTGHPYGVKTDTSWLHHYGENSWPVSGSMYARTELERLP